MFRHDFISLYNLEINRVSDRRAMGLPESFLDGHYQKICLAYEQLRDLDKLELSKIVDSIDHPLLHRIAAGTLLGLIGDPRIAPLNPQMIKIPAQDAQIGSDRSCIEDALKQYQRRGVKREWLEKEYPRHRVHLNTFKIAKYPVTNQEYRNFLLDTQHEELPTSWAFGFYKQETSNHPVYSVSYNSAEKYVKWLSHKTKRQFRLPNELEWELASRGTGPSEYPWDHHGGPADKIADPRANTLEAGIFGTTPVGVFPNGTSPFGVFDMGGNVEEYTSSLYQPYCGQPACEDDLSKELGQYRVARGGSFLRFLDLARCARRHGAFPSPLYAMGFRIAED